MTAPALPPIVEPLRRAAIFVDDLERAMLLYRDVLGFSTWKRHEVVANPAFFRLLGLRETPARFAILQAGVAEVGMVGLFEVGSAVRAVVQGGAARQGEVALVFRVPDLVQCHAGIVTLGLGVICPPILLDVPGGGKALEMTFRDFDGVLVNLIEQRDPR